MAFQQEFAAGGVVYRQQGDRLEVLLVMDRFGYLALPKGKQEKGETISETALREVREETGVESRIVEPLLDIRYDYFPEGDKGKVVKKTVSFFLLEWVSGEVVPQLGEVQNASWYDVGGILEQQRTQGYLSQSPVLSRALARLALLHHQIPSLPARIDHTLLKPTASQKDIEQLCAAAKKYSFASVCVLPEWVRCAASALQGSPVAVCTVVGFPLGANVTEIKVAETKIAVREGATELDMVMNLGAFKNGDDDKVEQDIRAVVQAAPGCLVKVIIEVGYLDTEELQRACQIVVRGGAHFVKTSTGFGPGGASKEVIQAMQKAVGDKIAIKASGGIRDAQFARELVRMGADRLGTSSGEKMAQEER